MRFSTASVAQGLLACAAVVNAIPTITAVGNKLFDSTGKQFFVKGMYSAIGVQASLVVHNPSLPLSEAAPKPSS